MGHSFNHDGFRYPHGHATTRKFRFVRVDGVRLPVYTEQPAPLPPTQAEVDRYVALHPLECACSYNASE